MNKPQQQKDQTSSDYHFYRWLSPEKKNPTNSVSITVIKNLIVSKAVVIWVIVCTSLQDKFKKINFHMTLKMITS